MTPDTPTRYGTVSRWLHWGMAACLVWQFVSMLAADATADKAVQTFLRASHKQVGSLLMVLIVLRVLWALANRTHRPAMVSVPARIGHLALYALMLAIPVIALVRQYGSGRAFSPLGLPLFPGRPASEKIGWMVDLGRDWHSELAWVLAVLVAGHVAMAVWHRLRRDAHDVLPRMAGR